MTPAADLPLTETAAVSGMPKGRLGAWAMVIPVCAGAVVLGLLCSIAYGPVGLSLSEVVRALIEDSEGAAYTIVWNLRLPRALVGALVGLNLAVAGTVLQGTMRNALASPDISGVTAGGALAATIVMVLCNGLPVFLPMAAFAGALAAAAAVYAISWQPGAGTSPTRMVLAGAAVGSMLGAMTSFLIVYFSDRAQPVVLWLAGSVTGASWRHLRMVLPYSAIGFAGAWMLARPLNLLQLGEDAAVGLGLPLPRVRALALASAALLAASAVCVTGPIGFVGLMIPHMLRALGGGDHRLLVPAAALGGAALLVWADLAARMLGELPVGILIAAIGGPYFVALLYKKKLL